MIARFRRGGIEPENPDAYEKLLRDLAYPEQREMKGYKGGYILRQDRKEEGEFVTVNLFELLDAVKGFAGDDYEVLGFEAEATGLLSKVEPQARRYDVKEVPHFLRE